MIQHRFPPEAGLDEVPDDLEPTLPVVQPSALDWHVDLTRISGENLAWVAVLLVAVLVRVIGLTSWPLSAGEAGISSDALALVLGARFRPGRRRTRFRLISLPSASTCSARVIPSSG
jgi:hypothetical protein